MKRGKKLPTDTPSIMFSALTAKNWGRTFRFEAILKEDLSRENLETALKDVLPHFPNMRLTLRRGFFWAKQSDTDTLPEITEENGRLDPITARYRDVPNFRLLCGKRTLALESSHCQGDGKGQIAFFATLLMRYARLKDGVPEPFVPRRTPEQIMEDTFDAYYEHTRRVKTPKPTRAYHLPEVFTPGVERLRYFETDEQGLKDLAHRYGMTVTQYLAAVLILALVRNEKKPIDEDVTVAVPVNLRRFFKTRTLRNFVVQSRIVFSPKGRRDHTFSEVIEAVRGQLPAQLSVENLGNEIRRFGALKRNPVLAAVPYFIKKPALRLLQKKTHRTFSTIFTNLGETILPEDAARAVERLRFVNGDTRAYGLTETVSCISVNGILSVCFSNAGPDDGFYRAFLAIMEEEGAVPLPPPAAE